MIETQLLKTFCAVVEKRSFTKAGEVIYRTQSTVSSQIIELEKAYGTTLFIRSQKEIVLTSAGELLYSYAKKVLALIDESVDSINELHKVVKGNLLIGASTIPGTYILPQILSKFKGIYQDVNIQLKISNSTNIVNKILEHKLEVGAVGSKKQNNRLNYIELATDRILLVVPGSMWPGRKNITLEELKTCKFIYREDGSATKDIVNKALKDKGIKNLNIVMELGSAEAIKQAIKTGSGISFLSKWTINAEELSSSLRTVMVKELNIVRCFYIVFLKTGVKSLTTKAFINFCKDSKCMVEDKDKDTN